jgi:alpha-N-acetylglucosamine transferase
MSSFHEDLEGDYTLDKLLIFGLTEFEKLVFLDSDLWLLENLDFLFDRPHMTATKADNVFKDWDYLNSGTMVIEPNVMVLEGLLEKVKDIHKKRAQFGDQDVVQEYYPDWNSQTKLILPQKYNIFIYLLEDYCKLKNYHLKGNGQENSIAIVHFAGKVKPWMWENRKNIWYYLTRMKWNSFKISMRYTYEVLRIKIKA